MENITLVINYPKSTKSQSKLSKIRAKMAARRAERHAAILAAQQASAAAQPLQQKSANQSDKLGVKLLSAGTAACVADMITYPLDTAKVRLQLQGEGAVAAARSMAAGGAASGPVYRGIFGTLVTLAKTEGMGAWYSGLSAGLQRQMCFASIRIGLYDSFKQFYSDKFQATSDAGKFGVRVLAGLTTGGLAVVAAQPTDVVKVRLQAQGRGREVRYHGLRHAYSSIAATEGVRGLWKGALPNIARNSIVNVTELVSYDLIKEALLSRQLLADAMPCHVTSAFGAGLVTTLLASPVDVVKTRFMNAATGQYKGVLDCAGTMMRSEGPRAFYKGFMPSFVRLGSWNVVMFVTYEQIKRLTAARNSNIMILTTHMVPNPDVNCNINSNVNSIKALTQLSEMLSVELYYNFDLTSYFN